MRNTFEYFDEGVYLEHHGIKGQKWGIRRYQNPDGSLTEAGRKRYGREVAKAIAKENSSFVTGGHIGKQIPLINAKVPTVAQEAVAKKVQENIEQLKQLDKVVNAPFDYEEEKFWSKDKVVDKYIDKSFEDAVSRGWLKESDKEQYKWLCKYDDVGQNLFDDYLRDHPKEAKEYEKLHVGWYDSYAKLESLRKEIAHDILGSSANYPISKLASTHAVYDSKTGKTKYTGPTTAEDVLYQEVKRQTNHEYLKKIGEGENARYFYSQEELDAYNQNK